jgi:hypothetical protein
VKYLSTVSVFGMRTGKTTVLCEAAKKIGATVLCHSAEEAKRVAKEYEVDTIHLGSFPLRGSHKPILVDTHAVTVYALQMEKEVAILSGDLLKTKQTLEELTAEYAAFKKAKLDGQK